MGRMTSDKTLTASADKYLRLSSVHLICNYVTSPEKTIVDMRRAHIVNVIKICVIIVFYRNF